MQRDLKFENGIYKVDGKPLVLFHYSGFDSLHHERMTIHQDRYKASGDVLKLYKEYAEKLNFEE